MKSLSFGDLLIIDLPRWVEFRSFDIDYIGKLSCVMLDCWMWMLEEGNPPCFLQNPGLESAWISDSQVKEGKKSTKQLSGSETLDSWEHLKCNYYQWRLLLFISQYKNACSEKERLEAHPWNLMLMASTSSVNFYCVSGPNLVVAAFACSQSGCCSVSVGCIRFRFDGVLLSICWSTCHLLLIH